MVKGKLHAALRGCAFATAFLLCALAFFPPKSPASAGKRFLVEWEDGTQTQVAESELSAMLCDCTETELLVAENGHTGRISASAAFSERYRLLAEGDLAELLGTDFSSLDGACALALYRKFGNVGYYAGEFFAYDGAFGRTDRIGYREVMLLTGTIPAETLAASGAERLTVRLPAQPSGVTLFGTRIKEFGTFAPFYTENGTLLLATPGGTRLVAALPGAETLSVPAVHFCDEGALLPCTRLCALELPFVGSSVSPDGSDYDGRLRYMFAENVPDSLKRVKVTGGALKTFAFEGCPGIEEIELCGMDPAAISRDAFVGCAGLKKLHTPQAVVRLEGRYSLTRLPCGCCLYEREEA